MRRVLLAIASAALLATPSSLALAGQNVVVLVDDSGSMSDRMRSGVRRIQAAKDALAIVVQQLPADANVGLLALNQGWVVPLQPVNQPLMERGIQQLKAAGGTLLGQNMKSAADQLLELREQQVYGDYRLLVVTDGEANDQPVLEWVLQDVLARGLTVDVIGVDMQSDHSLATKVHRYRRADDPETLQQAIAESLAESDAQDENDVGAESDFELIAGLPDDVAMTILTTLSTAKNGPIGRDVQPHASQGDRGFDLQGRPPAPPAAMPLPTTPGQTGFSLNFGFLLCAGILFFGVSTIFAMLRAARRS